MNIPKCLQYRPPIAHPPIARPPIDWAARRAELLEMEVEHAQWIAERNKQFLHEVMIPCLGALAFFAGAYLAYKSESV